jgi:hypothetical protein
LLAGLLLYNDTEQYGHSWMIRALVYGRAISSERSIFSLCCALATDSNRKKEPGIVSHPRRYYVLYYYPYGARGEA